MPKKNNAGVEKTEKAAKAIGAKVIIPKFTEEAKAAGCARFNDLASLKMVKKRVKDQLQAKIPYLSKSKNKGLGF